MEEKIVEWWSPSLGHNMEMVILGDKGTPVLVFPTHEGNHEEWSKNGVTRILSHQLENGYNQLFCVDTIDQRSLFNKEIHPSRKMIINGHYQSYILEEVIPYIHAHNENPYLIVAGVGFGAYHALNMAFKYPRKFGKVIAIDGHYDIRNIMDNFYDDNVYYNNPVDYLSNLTELKYLSGIRNLDIRIASIGNDKTIEDFYQLSEIMNQKWIKHDLDIRNNDSELNNVWNVRGQAILAHLV